MVARSRSGSRRAVTGSRYWRGGVDGLASTAKEVEAAGGEALVVPTDVASWAEVDAAATRVEAELGPIDVWVNNAMTSVFAPFSQLEPEEFERVTAVNYLGFVYGTMAALRRMQRRDRGTIVQVGSALALRSIPLQSAVLRFEARDLGLYRVFAHRASLHDHSGVHVTMVQMPAMNTPQFSWVRTKMPKHPQPVAPIYQPEVAAKGVLFAADHPDRHNYYVGISTSLTVLANKIAPGLLDRYLAATGYASQQMGTPVEPRPGRQPLRARSGRASHARHLRRRRVVAQPSTVGDDAQDPDRDRCRLLACARRVCITGGAALRSTAGWSGHVARDRSRMAARGRRSGRILARRDDPVRDTERLSIPMVVSVDAKMIFQRDCSTCHGADAAGTAFGPSLQGVGRASVDYWLTTGRMPLVADTRPAKSPQGNAPPGQRLADPNARISRHPPAYAPDGDRGARRLRRVDRSGRARNPER